MRCPTEMLLGRRPRYVQGSVGHTVKGHEGAGDVQGFLGFWSTGRTWIFPFVNSKNWCYQSVDNSSVHCASVLLEGRNPSGDGEWTNIHAVCIRKLQPWPKLGISPVDGIDTSTDGTVNFRKRQKKKRGEESGSCEKIPGEPIKALRKRKGNFLIMQLSFFLPTSLPIFCLYY